MNRGNGTQRLRVLVAIASYGEKNLSFLKSIIATYRAMAFDLEVMVFSDAPKDLGPEVKVVVGLPSKNTWSLPFAHKSVFAEKVDQYDLFVYTEDDIEVSEAHLQVFLRVTPHLAADEIAGYIRYEVATDGSWMLTDVHGPFRWRPDSLRRRGDFVVGEFSNDHAGFYILTQSQLRRAIASGGYLLSPYDERYGMPETAATDPYFRCGFRKVVCLSALEDFLIRHMSNLYVNRHGVTLAFFKEQVDTLQAIERGAHPASSLLEPESKMPHLAWSKSFYEPASEGLLKRVPAGAKRVLSVGCGWGAAEEALRSRGVQVTVLPLDSVFGAALWRRGFEVIHGTLLECLGELRERRFDCVLVPNLLHLSRAPRELIEACARLVDAGGTLVVSGPNFDRMPTLVRRALGIGAHRRLRRFEAGGITVCGPSLIRRSLRRQGFRTSVLSWLNHALAPRTSWAKGLECGGLTAKEWVLAVRRNGHHG